MAGVTSSQRELGWNVRILISSSQTCFAGFYQQDDFATVADVRRELDLCFDLQDGPWRSALLGGDPGSLITLDKDDSAAFPTPPPQERANYYYVFHDLSCHDAEHFITSDCVRPADRP
ncbi:hypothetical protein FJTKL_15373 [Diaporthe vaccinii]|uniref:Uncharacterized protein n=1 Tax=Diaporthe vaccinii TaxID=105482 RepID=A0ABR4E562_9PEZI